MKARAIIGNFKLIIIPICLFISICFSNIIYAQDEEVIRVDTDLVTISATKFNLVD